jgi:flagellar assembly protein FliH
MTRPFRFERDFDNEPAGRSAEPMRPQTPVELAVQTASARLRADFDKRLEAARANAFEEGRDAGRREGQDAAAASLAGETERLARAIADALPPLQATVRAQVQEITDEAIRFVVELVERLLPGLEADLGELRLERFLERALRTAPRAASLAVAVPTDALPDAEAALARLGPLVGTPLTVQLHGDPGLSRGDARVTWEQGGMALQPSRAARTMLEACARLAGRSPPARPMRPRREPKAERPVADTMERRS